MLNPYQQIALQLSYWGYLYFLLQQNIFQLRDCLFLALALQPFLSGSTIFSIQAHFELK